MIALELKFVKSMSELEWTVLPMWWQCHGDLHRSNLLGIGIPIGLVGEICLLIETTMSR